MKRRFDMACTFGVGTLGQFKVQTQWLNHGVLAQTAQEDERFALAA